jgi:putative restriction endonuclease
MKKGEKWSREELIVAFNLYCKIPFSKINYKHSQVIRLAKLIGRTPSAVALKLVNFARLDPELQKRNITGMKHGSKGEEEVWKEFFESPEELAFESERTLANFKGQSIEKSADIEIEDLPKEGKEREAKVKIRVNQKFFRSSILASYNSKCCITGLSATGLLVASHIVPWAIDKKNRLNLHNGLCLNALHDKAFDKGLIAITPEYQVILSPLLGRLKDKTSLDTYFWPFKNKQIELPQRFFPDKNFLKYHYENIFINK